MLSVIILLVSTLTSVFSLATLPLRGSLSQKGKTEKKPLPASPKGRRSNKRILLIEN
jgi:hypothetical protein